MTTRVRYIGMALRAPVDRESLRGREVFVTGKRDGGVDSIPYRAASDPYSEDGVVYVNLDLGYGRTKRIPASQVRFYPAPFVKVEESATV